MKQTTAILSSILIVGSVHAASDADVYQGWAKGNPDLSTEVPSYQASAAVAGQPGIGDSVDHYGSWGKGNPELTLGVPDAAPDNSRFPDVYGSFSEF